jgi:DNA-3-methyladenine glycosylase I
VQDLIKSTRIATLLGEYRNMPPINMESLEFVLLRISEMVCELPWIREIDINPLIVDENGAVAVDARIIVDNIAPTADRYDHMAIHPYPSHLITKLSMPEGEITVRPIKPEDAELEIEFVRKLSPETKYLRFMNTMRELPPAMVARLTQIDYDREMAFVATIDEKATRSRSAWPLRGQPRRRDLRVRHRRGRRLAAPRPRPPADGRAHRNRPQPRPARHDRHLPVEQRPHAQVRQQPRLRAHQRPGRQHHQARRPDAAGLMMNAHPSVRCAWCGDPLYQAYHDTEWGVPLHDDRALFELLTLEGAQAGLSWITVLRKRDNYRAAFAGFDPGRRGRFTEADQAAHANPGIVRNRLKIASTIDNARAFLAIQAEFGSFDAWLWRFVDGRPIHNTCAASADAQASTPLSDALSKALKKRGFRFVGSTICYAFMQAAGLVNDHTTDCFRHREVPRYHRPLCNPAPPNHDRPDRNRRAPRPARHQAADARRRRRPHQPVRRPGAVWDAGRRRRSPLPQPEAVFDGHTPIRGGVPVCFPSSPAKAPCPSTASPATACGK